MTIEEKDAKAKELGATAKVTDGDKVCYFRLPSRMAIGTSLSMLNTDVVQACEIIFNDACIREVSDYNHWLNDNELFNGICGQLQSLIRVKKSTWMTF